MKRIVEWFIANPIAANLLMVLIIIGGLASLSSVSKQFFPADKGSNIRMTMLYPGAGPAEVETQIVMRIEEAIDDIDGIDEIKSYAREGGAELTIKVMAGYDGQRLVNDLKSRVDTITTFPVDAERAQIAEIGWQRRMITVALYGDIDEASLKELGEQIRDDLAGLSDVGKVELKDPRDYEMSIEVSEDSLRRYGLRFDDVVNAIRNSSLNLPAGKLRTDKGDIQLQTRAQGYTAVDFETIVLLRDLNGTQIFVGDVATVVDGFAETDIIGRFNNQPALSLNIFSSSEPNVIKTATAVRDYVESYKPQLPPGVEMKVWKDMSEAYELRIGTLLSNGLGGLLLVFLVLMLFLRPLLAMWVCIGIAVAFLGALWMIPVGGGSLDMVSLFAFILILGIVVDDAIIVSESVYSHQQGGLEGVAGANKGATLVIKPVIFAVVSTMIFFSILFLLPGNNGSPTAIALVVMAALCFSLIESLLILPAHLAHMGPEKKSKNPWMLKFQLLREACANGMLTFADKVYRPFLDRCMAAKRLTVSSFFVLFLISLSLLMGGWLQSSFFPRVPADFMKANITMPEGGPFAEVRQTVDRVEQAAKLVKKEFNQQYDYPVIGNIESNAVNNVVRVTVELLNVDKAKIPPQALKASWQSKIGDLAIADEFDINFTVINVGKPIELILSADDTQTLREFSREVREEFAKYPAVFNVRDSLDSPRPEIQLRLKPQAQTLNLSLADVAKQVRRGFYGEEVQRIPRAREDVKVMVRYPNAERRSEDFLRDMRIRTPDGTEVPFEAVAEVDYVDGYAQIERLDRQRISIVKADLNRSMGSAGEITAAVMRTKMPEWQSRFSGAKVVTSGEQKEFKEFGGAMVKLLFGGIVIIYGLIAVAFKSYWKPLLVLAAIPFGLTGAILGHVILGIEISMFSMMGIIAAVGVVVNDNLVLIDRINLLRDQGVSVKAAILEGAQDRFRPIILTSMTTLIGLLPIMLETSVQAQFLIPMVVSLAFGVMAATVISLVFVPVLYLSLDSRMERIKVLFQPKKTALV
ncbi:efflux RND transporter permease subunit [Oceanicoccus sagamiensis]|uniref:Acriflavin resistance protein n=1 Tax=Oceanicoccus sagamiensis TaxID=716816 RepID=A0A1X9N5L2_9GAMM|nr:efflux RND transporter permease subunit [Oceanicoccus sagamiensis]ARN73378.1 hypothetical protein BST96_04190 [Oceanicoccus sagamiensis]